MADQKYTFPGRTQDRDTGPQGERRRLSRIVHDHKGNATVEWLDAPGEYQRPLLEIEGSRQPAAPTQRAANTGSLQLESEDSHNPYTRIPENERKRASGTRTDLRKLSAWIKMMRTLEEAKKNKDED
jgi:hypothetical protein